jgi:predicted nucleic acid-binding protein
MRYFDSSALVKRYVREAGTREVRALLGDGRRAVTSRVAFAEIAAAVARRARAGDLAAAARGGVLGQLERDFEVFDVIDATAEVVAGVPALVRRHPLRGFDAVHLASCLLLCGGRPGSIPFVCADASLAAAARACGLEVLVPCSGPRSAHGPLPPE